MIARSNKKISSFLKRLLVAHTKKGKRKKTVPLSYNHAVDPQPSLPSFLSRSILPQLSSTMKTKSPACTVKIFKKGNINFENW